MGNIPRLLLVVWLITSMVFAGYASAEVTGNLAVESIDYCPDAGFSCPGNEYHVPALLLYLALAVGLNIPSMAAFTWYRDRSDRPQNTTDSQ